MFLKSLNLVNYKNFKNKSFKFNSKVNCFIGLNGIGKTNILDAIYHLSFCKSYFNPISTQNIMHGEDFFVIGGTYEFDTKEQKIAVSIKKGSKKIIKRNGKKYKKFSDHIGLLPLVIISPADTNIISEGSDIRRKFIDGVISQVDKSYLNKLMRYNRSLSQRNTLLKHFKITNTFNSETIEIYNHQMNELGSSIYLKRRKFIKEFKPLFLDKYNIISNNNEKVELCYKSQLREKNFKDLLKTSIYKDRDLQYTSVGIHKDDFEFKIQNFPIKKFGSQGQQKSFLIALKMAQFEILKNSIGRKPILLLDDIFDKLDTYRVQHLIEIVKSSNFGQIFITDTNEIRTEKVIESSYESYQIFRL